MRIRHLFIVAMALACFTADVYAQPIRQMPGSRPFLPGAPLMPPANPNTRTRPAASAVGLESTDFYPKNGYPKQLGDAVEAGSNQGASAAGGAAGGAGGGVSGVQAAGSGGFQGNTGNQIGQQGGGTVFGGLFGGNNTLNGGNQQGLNPPMDPIRANAGFTGGGFSGMVPKGFGFGGTPDLSKSWTTPLTGGLNK
jgi:hypothetical protein